MLRNAGVEVQVLPRGARSVSAGAPEPDSVARRADQRVRREKATPHRHAATPTFGVVAATAHTPPTRSRAPGRIPGRDARLEGRRRARVRDDPLIDERACRRSRRDRDAGLFKYWWISSQRRTSSRRGEGARRRRPRPYKTGSRLPTVAEMVARRGSRRRVAGECSRPGGRRRHPERRDFAWRGGKPSEERFAGSRELRRTSRRACRRHRGKKLLLDDGSWVWRALRHRSDHPVYADARERSAPRVLSTLSRGALGIDARSSTPHDEIRDRPTLPSEIPVYRTDPVRRLAPAPVIR